MISERVEPELRGIRASRGRSRKDLEDVAASVRRQLGFDKTEKLPGVEFFYRLDRLRVRTGEVSLALDYGVERLPAGCEALARFNNRSREIELIMDEDAYLELESDGARARFSLFHELSHAVLHPRELMRLGEMPGSFAAALHRKSISPHPAYTDTEWQANGLAGALLMPLAGLNQLQAIGMISPREIAQEFGVSVTAANVRLDIVTRHFDF